MKSLVILLVAFKTLVGIKIPGYQRSIQQRHYLIRRTIACPKSFCPYLGLASVPGDTLPGLISAAKQLFIASSLDILDTVAKSRVHSA